MSSLERLSVPRRQKVFNRKLLPKGDKLPYWGTMSLDSKLPIAPSPRGSYTLFTTALGQPKYINKQRYDFDLTDPLGNSTPAEYDSLQDPYLKPFFKKPRAKHHLVENGLLTRDEKIVCSLKEFNEYREYLRYRSVTDFNLKRHRQLERQLERRNNRKDRKAKSEGDESIAEEEERRNSILKARLDSYARSESLVSKLKRRESLLTMRMDDKRFQHMLDTERRIKESWEARKERQKQMLERETQIEKEDLERRRHLLEERERTLIKQRDRQLAKLEQIKKQYLKEKERKFGRHSYNNSFDRSSQSYKGSESIEEIPAGKPENPPRIRTSTPVEKTKRDDKPKNDADDKSEKENEQPSEVKDE